MITKRDLLRSAALAAITVTAAKSIPASAQAKAEWPNLIEAKAINIELKDAHVKQAVDYAANEGITWVVLSNGAVWRLYCLKFGKPIDKDSCF